MDRNFNPGSPHCMVVLSRLYPQRHAHIAVFLRIKFHIGRFAETKKVLPIAIFLGVAPEEM